MFCEHKPFRFLPEIRILYSRIFLKASTPVKLLQIVHSLPQKMLESVLSIRRAFYCIIIAVRKSENRYHNSNVLEELNVLIIHIDALIFLMMH